MTRAEYEQQCIELGFTFDNVDNMFGPQQQIRSDRDIQQSYGLKYGDYRASEYCEQFIRHVALMRARLQTLEAEQLEAKQQKPQTTNRTPHVNNVQIWDDANDRVVTNLEEV